MCLGSHIFPGCSLLQSSYPFTQFTVKFSLFVAEPRHVDTLLVQNKQGLITVTVFESNALLVFSEAATQQRSGSVPYKCFIFLIL